MLTTLKTAYSDTRAGDLAWALGREALHALATLDLRLGDARVELRLLGASHQVILEEGGEVCTETVACMPGSTAPLPLGVSKQLGDWDYEFASRVETLSPGTFVGRAQELIALVAEHPNGLAGTYPGSPHAFTALLVQRHGDQIHWRTWHSYPQEGSLVSTRTRVALRVPGTEERTHQDGRRHPDDRAHQDGHVRPDGRVRSDSRAHGVAGREGALL